MLSQLRAGIDVVCPVRRERSGGADAHPSRLDRRDERQPSNGLKILLSRDAGALVCRWQPDPTFQQLRCAWSFENAERDLEERPRLRLAG